jgi:hypothetical protein
MKNSWFQKPSDASSSSVIFLLTVRIKRRITHFGSESLSRIAVKSIGKIELSAGLAKNDSRPILIAGPLVLSKSPMGHNAGN